MDTQGAKCHQTHGVHKVLPPVHSLPSSVVMILHSTGDAHEKLDTAKALPILGTCAAATELDSHSLLLFKPKDKFSPRITRWLD